MSWRGEIETNPHFRPPPNQLERQHSPLPIPGAATTTPWYQDHQNQPRIEVERHSQPPRSAWVTQPPIQDQFTQPPRSPVPRAKKQKQRQDRRYWPLGAWSMTPMDQEVRPQPPRGQQQPHGPDQATEPQWKPQPQWSQATQPKHHGQPHGPETAIPPLHQDHYHRSNSQGLRKPTPRQTKLYQWFFAGFCAIFWIVIILGGIVVLIVYLFFRPHNPRFDVSSVSLNAAYLDVGVLLNADLNVLANFTNPNKKVKVDFSYVVLDLYYGKTLIASQYVEPFSAARRTSWLTNVHLVTSQVRLPFAATEQLKKEIDSNAVMFQVKGVFRARSDLGTFLRYSYWLYSHCTIVLSGPPSGVLRASKCRTKR